VILIEPIVSHELLLSPGRMHTSRRHCLACFFPFFCVLASLIPFPTSGLATSMSPSAPSSSTSTFNPDTLAVAANAYAAAHGVQVERKTDDGASIFQCAPISLLPNAYPKAAFVQAVDLAPSFNLLVDRISRDADFLQQTLGGSVSSADPYTAKLLTLYRQVYVQESTKNQPALAADRLGIHRSDYMLNRSSGNQPYMIKQVELNTIASSFAGLACQVANLHSYLLDRYASSSDGEGAAVRAFLAQNQKSVTGGTTTGAVSNNDGVPVNPALERLPAAMNVAVQRYRDRFLSNEGSSNNNKRCCVLFVVQEGETNTVDQRMLEFRLFAQHRIPVVRLSLRQIQSDDCVAVSDETGALTLLPDGTEVAVVYFRAGYAPTDYPGGDEGVEWQGREKLERSRATKCPSLGYHLAGTKKVQQELARPGVLERFFPDDADQVAAMRSAFAGLYSLGDDAVEEDVAAVKDVLAGGQGRYVLKPQREGGGYNFYGDELAAKLTQNVTEAADGTLKLDAKLGEYILMERLFPPQQTAILVRAGRIEGSGESISELGCFGTIVASSEGEVAHNEYAGFLLRTKFSNVDEGGVASGFATLSSPYLC